MDMLENTFCAIALHVENIKGGECEHCMGKTDYDGRCQGYSWDVSCGSSGVWNFSLYCHTLEVWHRTSLTGVDDLLLSVLKGLYSDGWKGFRKDGLIEIAVQVVNAFDQANTADAVEQLGSRGLILKKAIEELRSEVNCDKQRTILLSE